MNTENQIASNLALVKSRLRDAEVSAGKQAGSVTLVAITKTQSMEAVRLLLNSGHKVFGENKVQEAIEKWQVLREHYEHIQLHMVGALQSNKSKQAVMCFDVIETLDRPSLARELSKHMDTQGRRPECFVQVNTGEERQKAGVLPKDADRFIKSCREEFNLPVTGLMCIPPAAEEPSPHFVFLAQIAHRNGLKNLSMGMSSDYLVAARFGATHVRVGTAIFGKRRQDGET